MTLSPVLVLDALGWASAAGVLFAYALLTRDPAAATSWRYLALNVAGSAGTASNPSCSVDSCGPTLSSVTEPGSYRVPVSVTISGYRDVAVKGSYEVTVYVSDTEPAPEPPANTDSQPETNT